MSEHDDTYRLADTDCVFVGGSCDHTAKAIAPDRRWVEIPVLWEPQPLATFNHDPTGGAWRAEIYRVERLVANDRVFRLAVLEGVSIEDALCAVLSAYVTGGADMTGCAYRGIKTWETSGC